MKNTTASKSAAPPTASALRIEAISLMETWCSMSRATAVEVADAALADGTNPVLYVRAASFVSYQPHAGKMRLETILQEYATRKGSRANPWKQPHQLIEFVRQNFPTWVLKQAGLGEILRTTPRPVDMSKVPNDLPLRGDRFTLMGRR